MPQPRALYYFMRKNDQTTNKNLLGVYQSIVSDNGG